ncbi:hypothetical protein NDA16_000862 [Ustilago loliicola]|nr:hypothetical protein NDA16_000862 [Ustilago loliicola]
MATPEKRRQCKIPFSSDRSNMWYNGDDNDSSSGEDKEDDGDTDSTVSTDSADSIVTPESSSQHRHAILHGNDAAAPGAHATVIGAFDANGNWTWSTQHPKRGLEIASLSDRDPAVETGPTDKAFTPVKPALNRHDRTQIVMTGGGDKLSCQRRASDVLWSNAGNLTQDLAAQEDEEDDDSFDVVGYTSYHSRSVSTSRIASEGHSIVVPVRIRLEDDSSSDESECSVVTSSSSGSDSEARRQAGINMLQRLGRTITIPERRTSAIRLGQGAPRRPPSLDEISNRVVGGGANVCGRGSPPGTAVPHQRAVSCPSPLPLQRAWFGEVEVMVTPPTPQMPSEKIPGVILKSPHMPSSASFTDAYGQLIAPAFDVAPGRQIMLEERERQAKEWLEKFKSQQQERRGLHLQLGTGAIAPPMANVAQAAAKFTPSSPSRSKAPSLPSSGPSNDAQTGLQQHSGAPPIPPRRRSFGRRVSSQTAADKPMPEQTEASGSDVVYVPKRMPSPINVPSAKPECRVQVQAVAATPRRSLVARLSLRRTSKELIPGQAVASQSQISRKPVPLV